MVVPTATKENVTTRFVARAHACRVEDLFDAYYRGRKERVRHKC
jgi:hypothetical protein